MVVHAGDLGSLTCAEAKAELAEKEKKVNELKERNNKILELSKDPTLTVADISSILHLPKRVVRRIRQGNKKKL